VALSIEPASRVRLTADGRKDPGTNSSRCWAPIKPNGARLSSNGEQANGSPARTCYPRENLPGPSQESTSRRMCQSEHSWSPGGLLAELTQRVLEHALDTERSDHRGYERDDKAGVGSASAWWLAKGREPLR
jgi:hypothetical protein